MANWYVWSGAAGAGTGADWTNAYTTLAAACTAKAAGDTFFVAHDHVENPGSAITITSPGTEALPCSIYCVNRAGSVPPVSADLRTTATISTNGAFGIIVNGSIRECYGIAFTVAPGGAFNASMNVGNTATRSVRLVNCKLRLNTTTSAVRIIIGGTGTVVSMENTTVQFGSVSQGLQTAGRIFWRNTSTAIAGATIPTGLFANASGASTILLAEGVDLSALTSGKSLIVSTTNSLFMAMFKDCKLGAGVTVGHGASPGEGSCTCMLCRCDSGDTNYRTEYHALSGSQTTETTIVRTGGASDGTTPIAWKIVTGATLPIAFDCLPISVWNETTGSAVTVTIQGIWGTGSVPRNDDIWIDCEYLGTSGFPLASKATSTKADGLAADAALSAGTGTWGGSTTKFAMSATFTPQEKGPITIYVRAALPSSTFYIDPKPVIT
jgi:hypothetical protein